MSSLTDLVSDDGKKDDQENELSDMNDMFFQALRDGNIIDVESNGNFMPRKTYFDSLSPMDGAKMVMMMEKHSKYMKSRGECMYFIRYGELMMTLKGKDISFNEFVTVMWNDYMVKANMKRSEAMIKMNEMISSLKFYEYPCLSFEKQVLFMKVVNEAMEELKKKNDIET